MRTTLNASANAPAATAAVLVLILSACSDKPADAPTAAAPPPPPAPASVQAPTPSAPAAPVAAEKKNVDADLAAAVKRALEGDKELMGQGIEVTAAGGKINLWGTVGTEADRDRAARLASGIIGVTTIENKLVVVRGS